MQITALQVFHDIGRLRSISRAAAANGVTQSAVSQLVRQIENRLGVQLLDRSVRPLELTPEGRRYHEGCKDLMERYQDLEASLHQTAAERAVTVQVTAIYSVGLRNMNHYVTRFVAQQPGASVHIEYLHPDRVYEKVLDGTADLGLLSFPRKSRDLAIIPWRDEEMAVVCRRNDPLARLAHVPIARIAGHNYVHFDKNLVIRREVDRFLRQHGVTVDVALEFDNIENIKHAIEVSGGLSLLPLPTVQREVRTGTLAALPLSDARMVRPLAIIHKRRQRLTEATRRFIKLLQQADEPDGPMISTKVRESHGNRPAKASTRLHSTRQAPRRRMS
ncbi:MAG: LysR family transcriptional regulator [Vicinamibacteria bacterium]|nr:LysR family transcriptional regulator [Vicinamibacteria bacterium]